MALTVFEEELGAGDAMAQVLLERGFSGFTIPYVQAGYFTGGDYFAEITQLNPSAVICTPRFNVPAGDEGFFKALLDLYRYNSPFNPSMVPFMYSRWWQEQVERGGVWPLKNRRYVLSEEIQPLGGKLYRTFAAALYAARTRREVIIDEHKGEYVKPQRDC